jgi:hypothetical protein
MSTLGEKLKHELRELIPVTLFFFGTFSTTSAHSSADAEAIRHSRVFLFDRDLHGADRGQGGPLITDHFSLVNRFSDKPLSYSVAWKTAIYFIHFWRQTGNFARPTAGCSRKSSGRISGACKSGCSFCCWFIARSANWFGLSAASE